MSLTVNANKLHSNEHDISAALVRRLIAAQFPQWAHLLVHPVEAVGTVHVLYRLGDELVVRLPRVGVAPEEIVKEHTWLPRLAPKLPVPIPVPLGRGEPTPEYPCVWSVYSWLGGANPEPGALTDPLGFACDLAAFIAALQSLDIQDAPESERGRRRLAPLDTQVRQAVDECRDFFGAAALTAAWNAALSAPPWDGRAVWVHADLLPGNLLVHQGRLNQGRLGGVIDFGSLGTGDPASDFNVAWSVLPAAARQEFRSSLKVDEGTWNRARGLAFIIALMALPYYQHTNPVFAEIARATITEVLADHQYS